MKSLLAPLALAAALACVAPQADAAVTMRFVPSAATVNVGQTIAFDLLADIDEPVIGFDFEVMFDPLLATLTVGELWYRKGQQKTHLSVAFGFAEVLPDRVTILARSAETADEIDEVRAEAQRQRALGEMQKPNLSQADLEKARASMLKALTRLQVASRRRAPRM